MSSSSSSRLINISADPFPNRYVHATENTNMFADTISRHNPNKTHPDGYWNGCEFGTSVVTFG